MKCYLVINPRARGGRGCRLSEAIFQSMGQAGLEYDYTYASSFEGMRSASAYAHGGDYDAIVAVGGDGTINAVVNGFFDEKGKLRSAKRFGVIYTGTSPDFCKSYGVPLLPGDAIRAIADGETGPLRIGTVTFRKLKDDSEEQVKYFACCASVGIGSMVASRANHFRNYLGDFPGTLTAILVALLRFRPDRLNITTEAGEQQIAAVTNVFVGRTRYIASGMKSPQAMGPDDPRFYVLAVHHLNPVNLFQLLRQLFSGNMRESPVTRIFFSEKVHLQSESKEMEVEFDGDPAGYTPCTFQAAPESIQLIRSPQAGF